MASSQTPPLHINEKIWPPGVPYEMSVDERNLWELFEELANNSPVKIGVFFAGQTYTWEEIHQQALNLAGGIQSLGVDKGDRVILFAQNTPEFIIAFHAILRCGAIVVPVNPMNKASELMHCIKNSGAKVAISAADIASSFSKANELLDEADRLEDLITFSIADNLKDESKVPLVWRELLSANTTLVTLPHGNVHEWRSLTSQQLTPAKVSTNSDDLALLMYTSGTTGNPKACMHSHYTIMSNIMQPKMWHDLQAGDVNLLVSPLFHITGLVGGLLCSIYSGASVVVMPRWDRRSAAEFISEYRVTHWTNIPTMVVDLLSDPDIDNFDLTSLRHIGGGGAAMPSAIAERLKSQFGLDYIEGYGLTETAAPSHCNPRNAPKYQCLGIPITNTHSCILDIDSMTAAGPDTLGEILIDGPQIFLGYWNNPQATEETFIELDGRRWFRSGDLGRMDSDGYYYIADRIKRMINASGFKIWPAELEALMYRHPAIADVCIISKEDPYRGQSAKAVVVLKPSEKEKTSAEDIISWARENMSAYKVPKEIEFVDSLPKSGTGKVMWRALQAEQDKIDKANANS